MRILADENVPDEAVAMLRGSGHDVLSVSEERPRTPDPDVLQWATEEHRLLLTLGKDFGELSQREGRSAPFGVVFFRIADNVIGEERAGLITQNVNADVDWAGYLWVITIRKRLAMGRPSA